MGGQARSAYVTSFSYHNSFSAPYHRPRRQAARLRQGEANESSVVGCFFQRAMPLYTVSLKRHNRFLKKHKQNPSFLDICRQKRGEMPIMPSRMFFSKQPTELFQHFFPGKPRLISSVLAKPCKSISSARRST